jgi:hypothetical protein
VLNSRQARSLGRPKTKTTASAVEPHSGVVPSALIIDELIRIALFHSCDVRRLVSFLQIATTRL